MAIFRTVGARMRHEITVGNAPSARLDGLASASATDAWAVGPAWPSSDSAQPLFLHWNGRQWARIPWASVQAFGYVSWVGVAAHSATGAWAVGEAVGDTNRSPAH